MALVVQHKMPLPSSFTGDSLIIHVVTEQKRSQFWQFNGSRRRNSAPQSQVFCDHHEWRESSFFTAQYAPYSAHLCEPACVEHLESIWQEACRYSVGFTTYFWLSLWGKFSALIRLPRAIGTIRIHTTQIF